jgi:HSP20 family protein
MAMIRRTSPLGEMLTLRNAVDRMFDDAFWRPTWAGRGLDEYQIPLDVQTTNDALVVKAALPGVKPEDVEITLDGNTLSITGKFDEELEQDEQGYLVRELRRGAFSRSITLSSDLDTEHAKADFENGIVSLTIPKAEQAKPRRIPLTAGNGASANQGSRETAPTAARDVTPKQ